MPDQMLLPVAKPLTVLNLVALTCYYSPLSLRGYWPDAVFLLVMSLLTLYCARLFRPSALRFGLRAFSILNVLAVLFTSLSFRHGLLPVHVISAAHFADSKTYAYFLERGGQGLLNGCYGEIQYYQAPPYLPFLEIKNAPDSCSSLDYGYLMEQKQLYVD